MARGPGKYNILCKSAMDGARAKGALLIIFDGTLGDGIALQLTPLQMAAVPEILRFLADQIQADLDAPHYPFFQD